MPRARARARRAHRAPRHQAGQRPHLRSRPGQGRRSRDRAPSRGQHRRRDRHDRRHAALHGARAGERAAGDARHRRVQRRHRALRDARRHPPFGGESAVEIALQHVQMQPPPLPRGTPRSLEAVVERALAKDPADRYQSAVAMAEALERASARAGAGTDSSTPHPGSDDWWATPTEVQGEDPTEIVALDTRTLPRGGVDPTRKAPTMSPRRTVNPAARRRAVAVFVLALAVLSSPAYRGEGADRAPDRGGTATQPPERRTGRPQR